jgi:hypothetical protein
MTGTAAGAGFDLREFVAASLGSEIVEAAPLSASDLRILSEKLHSRLDELKVRLRRILADDAEQLHGVVRVADGAAGGVEALAEDVRKVVDALGEREESESGGSKVEEREGEVPFDVEICRLEERREYLVSLEFIVGVVESVRSAERAFQQGDLGKAGSKLCEVREQLELPADWTGDRDDERERQLQGDGVQAFNLLEDEWAACHSKV